MRMVFGVVAVATLVFAWSGSASAQEQQQPQEGEKSFLKQNLPPASNTFELKLGTGYTQGFGKLGPDRGIPTASGAGIGFSLDADYRMTSQASLGLESQYQEFVSDQNSAARGLALNIGATYHFSPATRGDPWVRLGTGYRMFWDVNPNGRAGTDMYHGFDIATLKVGYDIRTSTDVAISPVIGADLQSFVWRDADSLSPVQFGTFIYAGIQGRFDTMGGGGSTGGGTTITSSKR